MRGWPKEIAVETTPLHCSLFELCRRQIASDTEFMQLNGFHAAPPVDALLFENYRLFKLRRMLNYVAEHSRYYQRCFADFGIKPQKITSIADLRVIPLTNGTDLSMDPFAFLCVSQSKIERIITFTSSGTMGPKKRIFFTEKDLEAITDYMGAGMKTVAGSSDVVQILLPEGPVMGQTDLLARGVEKMGARPVIAGMFLEPQEQIEIIRRQGSTVIFGETHLIYRITKTMERHCDLARLGIHTLFLTTSHASEKMIAYLSRTWNARISKHYGLVEMGLGLAVDCPSCGAYHFNELDVICEVVDPKTGRVLPPGSGGELVFTTLQREGMPLIRYCSRDLAPFGPSAGSCDSPLNTIGHVESRVESRLRLDNGAVVYPTLFHDVVFSIPEVIDYELSIETEYGTDVLVFDLEVFSPETFVPERMAAQMKKTRIVQRTGVPVMVRFKPPGTLKQGAVFKKVVNDRRNHDN
jgi:phenylacetate-coenzyme A ligase PaaK-like adenylate-forming protein